MDAAFFNEKGAYLNWATANATKDALDLQLAANLTIQADIQAKVNNLDSYWVDLKMNIDTSSPFYLTCAQNDLLNYKKAYLDLFPD